MTLWSDLLRSAKPRLVIAMGAQAIDAAIEILKVQGLEQVPVNWGNLSGSTGKFDGGRFVGLPHLSRFPIVGRLQSQPALHALLGLPSQSSKPPTFFDPA
jgi:hypothetical protein